MLQGSPQFTPRQLLDAGRRAEAEGKLDHAIQLYRHLTDHYAYTAEATEARNGLGRIGAGAGQPLWAENGAAPSASPNSAPFAHGRMPGPHSGARSRAVAKERHYRTGRVLATLVSWAGWMIVAAGVAMVPLVLATDPPLLCCAACPTPRPWGPPRPSPRRLRSRPSASSSCSGGKWRARSSTRPTLHASWSPSSAQGGTSRVERDRRSHPLRRCSSSRGMISTKLQGRWRLSSCHLRMSFHASLQAPGDPGRQKM